LFGTLLNWHSGIATPQADQRLGKITGDYGEIALNKVARQKSMQPIKK
jgi:hypothetical protein